MPWLSLSCNVLSHFPPLTSHQCQTVLGELLQPMAEGKCLLPSPKKERHCSMCVVYFQLLSPQVTCMNWNKAVTLFGVMLPIKYILVASCISFILLIEYVSCSDLMLGNIYGIGSCLGTLCLSSTREREIQGSQYMFKHYCIGQKITVTQLKYDTAQKFLLGP